MLVIFRGRQQLKILLIRIHQQSEDLLTYPAALKNYHEYVSGLAHI